MLQQDLKIVPVFATDDQAWVRRSAIQVAPLWLGHSVAPALGDVIRVGGRQFVIEARVWEHDGASPILRLYFGSGRAQSDTAFG